MSRTVFGLTCTEFAHSCDHCIAARPGVTGPGITCSSTNRRNFIASGVYVNRRKVLEPYSNWNQLHRSAMPEKVSLVTKTATTGRVIPWKSWLQLTNPLSFVRSHLMQDQISDQ